MKPKQIVVLLLLTTACEQSPNSSPFSKANIGGLTGAAGGAWIGSNVGGGKGKIVSIAAGTLLGAFLGHSIGASLDKADLEYYHQTSQNALETAPTGQVIAWNNPDSGHSGTITPTRTFQSGSQFCREYSQTVNVGGKKQQAYGTACRQPDGSWKVRE
jgi:surface antigen